jgi:hypothetical protein
MEDVWVCQKLRILVLRKLFSRENLTAFILAVLFLLIFILTADTDPQWIYQGF